MNNRNTSLVGSIFLCLVCSSLSAGAIEDRPPLADGHAGTTNDGWAIGGADIKGLCGMHWASDSACGDPALEGTVTPTVDAAGDNWTFSFGRHRFVVSALRAGNIAEFSLDGKSIVETSPDFGMSTFFPSPQAAYDWPLAAELDGNPYIATLDGKKLTLVGATGTINVSKGYKLSFKKRFWVNAASGVVTIEYTIVNQGDASSDWAPQEVTRVPAGGFTFAPKGPGTRTFTEDPWQNPMPLTTVAGINWFDYAAVQSSLTDYNYLVEFDGAEGWVAHAQRIGGAPGLPLLLVKSFKDAADAAMPPNEGEIQLWTNGSASTDLKRIEVEEQGEAKTLEPKGELVWTTHWSLCELPSSVALSTSSTRLVQLALAHAVPIRSSHRR